MKKQKKKSFIEYCGKCYHFKTEHKICSYYKPVKSEMEFKRNRNGYLEFDHINNSVNYRMHRHWKSYLFCEIYIIYKFFSTKKKKNHELSDLLKLYYDEIFHNLNKAGNKALNDL